MEFKKKSFDRINNCRALIVPKDVISGLAVQRLLRYIRLELTCGRLSFPDLFALLPNSVFKLSFSNKSATWNQKRRVGAK